MYQYPSLGSCDTTQYAYEPYSPGHWSNQAVGWDVRRPMLQKISIFLGGKFFVGELTIRLTTPWYLMYKCSNNIGDKKLHAMQNRGLLVRARIAPDRVNVIPPPSFPHNYQCLEVTASITSLPHHTEWDREPNNS